MRLHFAPQIFQYGLPMQPESIEQMIRDGLGGAEVRVMSDDNTHFQAIVVSSDFEGKRPLARHQMVYKTLGALVGNEIHALSIKAMTPSEAGQD